MSSPSPILPIDTISTDEVSPGLFSNIPYVMRHRSTGKYVFVSSDIKKGDNVVEGHGDGTDRRNVWVLVGGPTSGWRLHNPATGKNLFVSSDDSKGDKVVEARSGNEGDKRTLFEVRFDGSGYSFWSAATGKFLFMSTDITRGDNMVEGHGRDEARNYFIFEPTGFTLEAALYDFNFGDKNLIADAIASKKRPIFVGDSNIVVKTLDAEGTIGQTYTQTVTETFSWGLSEKLGFGIKVGGEVGIPLVANGKVEVSTTLDLGSNQQWTTTRTSTFSQNAQLRPKQTGVYRLGMQIEAAEDVQFKFTGKARLVARNAAGKVVGGMLAKALFERAGMTAKIIEVGEHHVIAEVTGTLTASCAVSSGAVVERVDDVHVDH